jgi:adenosylcobinamide-phosphate synthase
MLSSVFPLLLGSPYPLLLLLMALVLDPLAGAILGDRSPLESPRWLALRAAGWFDRRLNRLNRSGQVRAARGLAVTILFVVAALATGLAATLVTRLVPYGWGIELALIVGALGMGAPWSRMRETANALELGGLEAGREAVRGLTGRQVCSLDEYGVVRVAIEGAADALGRRVVAPSLWYLLLGLPGLAVWIAGDALAWVIGGGGARHDRFGQAAARLHAVLCFVPARLGAVLIVLACPFVPATRAVGAVRTLITDSGRHSAPHAGWPEAAFAGALDVSLRGPRREGEVMIRDAWIGEGRARAVPADLRRALTVYAVACLLLAGGLAAGVVGMAYF